MTRQALELHLEKLWDRNISITTRLVDTVTTPMLLKVVSSGKVQRRKLVTHLFAMKDINEGVRHVRNAAKEDALQCGSIDWGAQLTRSGRKAKTRVAAVEIGKGQRIIPL